MSILKFTLKFIFLSVISISGFSQESKDIEFNIPENEFLISRMVSELEAQRNSKNLQIIQLERLKSLNQSNLNSLNSYKHEKIDSKEKVISSLRQIEIKTMSRNVYEKIENFELLDIARNNPRSYQFNLYEFEEINEIKESDFPKIDEQLKRNIENSKKIVEDNLRNLNRIEDQIKSAISDIDNRLNKLYSHKGQNRDLHRIAILMGLPAFCVTILLLFLIPYYLERKSETNNPNTNNKQYLLDVATVLLLTMTILILGLAKMITGEVLGTLLGGISGYVLNRTMKK
ncbi:hypothetical protein [Spongiimicrobium salis]|uniref:hypothetical protein n=1 Tax=Spongiimicrobium salis TaxID=1667022 RepID=UPI00374CEBA3